jgi:hypothetical protein
MGERKPLEGLLLETLEAESASVLVYEAALRCTRDPQLRQEWESQRAQSERQAEIAEDLICTLGLDPDEPAPGRLTVRDKGIALVDAILNVLAEAPDLAQVVAAECILDCERKSELNWGLLAQVAQRIGGHGPFELIRAAHAATAAESQVRAKRAHARCLELWLKELGMRPNRTTRREGLVHDRASC